MNRSNINTVGNVQVSNLGNGESVFAGKTFGNTLNLKTLSVTGATMTITSDDNNIYFSANTGGGTTYWTEDSGFIYPTNSNNYIRLDSNNYIGWSGTTTCVKSNSNALCLVNNTSCVHVGDTSIFNKANTTWFTNTSGCVMYITPDGKLTSQTASQTICVYGGPSPTASKAGSINICGGSSTSTGDGGDVVLRGGTSTGGSVGEIQLPTLKAKSTETNVLYIDDSGNLSSGATSGGGSDISGYTCAANNSISIGEGTMPYTVSSGGSCNVAIGYLSMVCEVTGTYNVALGALTLCCNTTGIGNVAIGNSSMRNNCDGDCNVGIGVGVLTNNQTGCYNVGIGASAVLNNTTGTGNIGLGQFSLRSNISNGCNVAIGLCAIYGNRGSGNIGIGKWTLCRSGEGHNNYAIGLSAVRDNTTGSNNVGIGYVSLVYNQQGSYNVAIGDNALQSLSGANAGADFNVAVGYYAGGNSLHGPGSGATKNVFIGAQAGMTETGSHKLHIANCNLCTLICGDFTGKTVTIDNKLCVANLQISTGAATGCVLTSDASGNASWGGGLDAFAALTSNSNATWDTSGGLNKTWSINGSYILTLTNVASGMYGTVKVTVVSGTPTITLSGSGITFKGNGSLASLATGTYILAWVASSATTVEWNIASYA